MDYITANFDPAACMAQMVANENAQEELQYQKAITGYNDAVQGWIRSNVHSRELSKDPTNFKPAEPPTVPGKVVYTLSGFTVTPTLWIDPSIQPPSLPAYVPPVQNVFFGGATIDPANIAARITGTDPNLAALLAQLIGLLQPKTGN